MSYLKSNGGCCSRFLLDGSENHMYVSVCNACIMSSVQNKASKSLWAIIIISFSRHMYVMYPRFSAPRKCCPSPNLIPPPSLTSSFKSYSLQLHKLHFTRILIIMEFRFQSDSDLIFPLFTFRRFSVGSEPDSSCFAARVT